MDKEKLLKVMQPDSPEDCGRVQEALKSIGVSASLLECEKLWQFVSDVYCAQWLIVPETVQETLKYIESPWMQGSWDRL